MSCELEKAIYITITMGPLASGKNTNVFDEIFHQSFACIPAKEGATSYAGPEVGLHCQFHYLFDMILNNLISSEVGTLCKQNMIV